MMIHVAGDNQQSEDKAQRLSVVEGIKSPNSAQSIWKEFTQESTVHGISKLSGSKIRV